VENRLAELWSILEFANPGLLGPLEKFRREVAIPVERYGDDAVAARLRRVVSPFVLRRLKSDPAVLQDLPPRHEMQVVCSLTREQASLYEAVVDAERRRIADAEGMERRGRVLALLTYTKQICNHPAQYLSERGPLTGRSGKLERLTEMLEEALAAGDKAQVHKLSSAGTVEEKIAGLLEQKRKLAAKVVGSGEHWLTELGSSELRELFSLSAGAAVSADEAPEAAGAGAVAGTPDGHRARRKRAPQPHRTGGQQ
jgi:SNF2 family DNA or RNA helicase